MSKVDLDYVMSKNTLLYIETTLLDYKKRILKDLSEHIDVSFKELESEFLVNTTQSISKYHGKDRSEIDYNLCMARVWHKTLGPVQCSRKSKIVEDDESEFCKIHLEKLNYGRIDEPIQLPE
jgi:hypothetical protein